MDDPVFIDLNLDYTKIIKKGLCLAQPLSMLLMYSDIKISFLNFKSFALVLHSPIGYIFLTNYKKREIIVQFSATRISN